MVPPSKVDTASLISQAGASSQGKLTCKEFKEVNTDLASPGPFKLSHSRRGTVSLSLSENDEDPAIRSDLITGRCSS